MAAGCAWYVTARSKASAVTHCRLMSTDTAQSLAEQIDALKAAARECGPLPDEPFIQMAFLSLPVIPALKLTSQGLFDGEKFAFTTLEVTE